MNLLAGKYQVFVEQVCDKFAVDPKCRAELLEGLEKYDRAMCEAEGRLLPREWIIRNIRNGEHLTENGNWGVNVQPKRFPSHDSAYGAYSELFGKDGKGWDQGYRIEEAPEYRYESDSHVGELVKKAKELGEQMSFTHWAEADKDDVEWISRDLAEHCIDIEKRLATGTRDASFDDAVGALKRSVEKAEKLLARPRTRYNKYQIAGWR
jgi:hypothetical protein